MAISASAYEKPEQKVQREMINLVQRQPGINLSELAEALDVHPSTIRYHDQKLEEEGWITTTHEGHFLLHFPARGIESRTIDRETVAALRGDARKRIVSCIFTEPWMTISEIARRLGQYPSTIQRHVDALVKRGVLEDTHEAGKRRIRLAPSAEETIRYVTR